MSAIKDLTPAILSAAVGIMAGYTSVSSAEMMSHAPCCVHEQNQDDIRVAEEIHQFIKSCRVMEERYRSTVKDVSVIPSSELASILSVEELAEFTAHVRELRNVELLLKTVEVPEQFADLHIQARRALAKGRSWVVMLHELTMQSLGTPDTFPGSASAAGVRALAEHSSIRLVELANA
ncbi:MAG: hypothetical protein KKC02_15135 [Gammaproteobacteria bacterium]|nr:hypothetical protein [Gammaproteobacteria bacterium]